MEDLVNDRNDLIVKQIPNESILTPVGVFYLLHIIDTLPEKWRNSLTSSGNKTGNVFVLNDQIDNALSKNIYAEMRSKYEASPTARNILIITPAYVQNGNISISYRVHHGYKISGIPVQNYKQIT